MQSCPGSSIPWALINQKSYGTDTIKQSTCIYMHICENTNRKACVALYTVCLAFLGENRTQQHHKLIAMKYCKLTAGTHRFSCNFSACRKSSFNSFSFAFVFMKFTWSFVIWRNNFMLLKCATHTHSLKVWRRIFYCHNRIVTI